MTIQIFDKELIQPLDDGSYLLEENKLYLVKCNIGSLKSVDFAGKGQYYDEHLGLLCFSNKVGFFQFKEKKVRVRSKFGDDFYDSLLKSISELEIKLLLSNNGLQQEFSLQHIEYHDEIAIPILLDSWRSGFLKKVILNIFNNDAKKIQEHSRIKNLCKGDKINSLDLVNLSRKGKNYIKLDSELYIPTTFESKEKVLTNNTNELNFFKFFLFTIIKLLKNATSKNIIVNSSNPTNVKDEINQLIKYINTILLSPKIQFLPLISNINLSSLKIQNKPDYRYILNLYLKMRKNLCLSSDLNSVFLNINSLESLYEYYCYIRILDDFKVPNDEINKLISKSKDGWYINKKYHPVIFSDKNYRLSLYFQYKFSYPLFSYSQNYEPDYSIKIEHTNGKTKYLHLDAKYKNKNNKAKKEDFDKMHAYTHAIKNSLGSIVLYPGKQNVSYACENSFIGGIYCTPNHIQDIRETIFKMIRESNLLLDFIE